MNMISTGAFLPETDASTKQSELVKKLTSAWEKKNSKTARAGGASLMALSLAACGGEDNTPFSAADVSAAEAAATTAALTGADGTVYASVDAAVTSNDAAIAEAAKAEVDITTDNQAAIDAAVAAVDLTTDNAAAIDAAVAADTAFADLASLVAAYDALANPAAVTLATTTSNDTLIGTSSNDSFTATSSTFAATDTIIDSSTTDSDTATITLTAQNAAGSITNIETVNFVWDAYGTAAVDLDNISGATVVNISSSKVGFLGSVNVTNANAENVVAGSGITGTVTVTGAESGHSLTANNASTVSVTGTGVATVTSTSATSVTTSGFATATISAEAATALNVTDNAKTTGSTTVELGGGSTTVTNSTTGALTLNAADGASITANAVGASLSIGGTGNVTLNSTASAEVINNVKTSGTLTVKNSTTGALDLDEVAADTIWLTGAKTAADTVANGASLKYSAAGTDVQVTVAGSGTADAVAAEVTAATVDDLALSGVETLTVTAAAAATSGADLTIADYDSAGNKLVLNGTNDVTITSAEEGTAGGSAVGTIDATGLTGALVISGTAANENITVIGGTGNNSMTFSGTSSDATFTGQTGNDTVTSSVAGGSLTVVASDGTNTTTAAGVVAGTVVHEGGSGVDTVTIGASGLITTATVTANTGAGDDVIAITADAGTLAAATISVNAGAGDDSITLTGDDTNMDTIAGTTIVINGGDGTDTLTLGDSGGSDDVDFTLGSITFNSIEVIQLADGSGDTTNATFQAADISGQTFTMKSDGSAGEGFTVVGAASTTVIDLSTLVIDQTISKAVSATTINGSAGTSAQTINGTIVADTITGGAGADTISAGTGADNITGGAGNDNITITEATADSAVDNVILNTAATNGVDTVTGFKVGTDNIHFDGADTSLDGGTGTAAAATLVGSAAAVVAGASNVDISGDVAIATDHVVELTTTLTSNGDLDSSNNGTELLKALSSTTTASTGLTIDTAGDKYMLVAYQDGKAYVYNADSSGTTANTTIDATEITLMAVLDGVTAGTMTGNDFLLL
jgi:hypothetical protein